MDFLEKVKIARANMYDYSKVNYINNHTKVEIICPKHGSFFIMPNAFISGYGCPKCRTTKKKYSKEKQDFQKIISKTFAGCSNINFSKSIYVNEETAVIATCSKHGDFKQLPEAFYEGYGCPKCLRELNTSNLNKGVKTTEQFIEEAKAIHDDLYDYSDFVYVNCKFPSLIFCKRHKKHFLQSAYIHLKGGECPLCSNNTLTAEEYIEKATIAHDGHYTYEHINFIGNKMPITVTCPVHGDFIIRADHHLKDFAGCKKCKSSSSGEIKIRSLLSKANITFEEQKTFDDLVDKRKLSYDFYIPSIKTLIEFNGIQHYKKERSFEKEYFKIQLHHDWMKRKYAKDNNYALVVIKYNEDACQKLINCGIILSEEKK